MPSQDDIDQQQQLLDTYRRNLAHYLRQRARLGSVRDLTRVAFDIAAARAGIVQSKAMLRGWGVTVEDYPDDAASQSKGGQHSNTQAEIATHSTGSAQPDPPDDAASQSKGGQHSNAQAEAAAHSTGSAQPDPPDDDQRQQLREVLRTHQSRLRVLELQQAQQGMQTPAHIITEIDAIQRQIARVTAQLMTATPARTREQQRKLRADAFKAYHRRAWATAEDLLVQALSADPEDHEVRERLRTVQQRLNADALYQAIRELRDEDLWQETLDALDDLQREYADAKDPDVLRAWAEGRKHWKEVYVQARQAHAKGDWQLVQSVLATLTNQQREDDPEQLGAWAEKQQRLADYYRGARFAKARGDWREVLKLLNARAAEDPTAPDSDRLGAWVEQEQQRVSLYTGAITVLEELLARFPDETPAREALDLLRGQI